MRLVTAGGVRLTWAAGTDDVAGPLTYEVLRNDRVLASGIKTLTYSDTTGKSTDTYVVRTVDAAGNRSRSTVLLGP